MYAFISIKYIDNESASSTIDGANSKYILFGSIGLLLLCVISYCGYKFGYKTQVSQDKTMKKRQMRVDRNSISGGRVITHPGIYY